MAKRENKKTEKDIDKVEAVSKPKVSPKKPSKKVKHYPLKQRLKVSGKWREIGDKIGLTEESYRYYNNKNIV